MKKIFMPMFEAEGAAGGSVGGESTDINTTGENASKGTDDSGKNEDNSKPDDIDKLVQAKVDKLMAEERKKSTSLSKELEKMKRDKMTAAELKKYDDEKRDKELAERERIIVEKENRYYAITALKKAGLDDGSEVALELAELVTGVDNEQTDTRIATLNKLITKMVDSKVNERFKSFGRTPGDSSTNSGNGKDKSLAEKLGKQKAEQDKKSREILDYYTKR